MPPLADVAPSCSPAPLQSLSRPYRQSEPKAAFVIHAAGDIVSGSVLVEVVPLIQGMKATCASVIAGAIVGFNAFQLRRDPIQSVSSTTKKEEDQEAAIIAPRGTSPTWTARCPTRKAIPCRRLADRWRK